MTGSARAIGRSTTPPGVNSSSKEMNMDVITATTMRVRPEFQVLLEGREAKCGAGCVVKPSSVDLAFFEYHGVGSAWHLHCDVWGMMAAVQSPTDPSAGRPGTRDQEFVPRVARDHDQYYCGCRGWD